MKTSLIKKDPCVILIIGSRRNQTKKKNAKNKKQKTLITNAMTRNSAMKCKSWLPTIWPCVPIPSPHANIDQRYQSNQGPVEQTMCILSKKVRISLDTMEKINDIYG